MKRAKWILGGFAAVVLINIALDSGFPAGLDTKSTERASAFLFAHSTFTDLPENVEISIDGVRAVFHRGDKSYDLLKSLLQNGRTQEMLDATGGPIMPRGPKCGELAIRSYGITSRFEIERTLGNRNIYWIWIPHLNRGGYAIPIFTADPRAIDLIKSTGTSEGAAAPLSARWEEVIWRTLRRGRIEA